MLIWSGGDPGAAEKYQYIPEDYGFVYSTMAYVDKK